MDKSNGIILPTSIMEKQLFLLKSKVKFDLRIFFLLARACCFLRHTKDIQQKLSHCVPTYHRLVFLRRFLLLLDCFWADIITLCCKAMNLQLHMLTVCVLGPCPEHLKPLSPLLLALLRVSL